MTRDTSDLEAHNVAIYGITGALGRELQAALEVEHEQVSDLIAVGGKRTAGQTVRWQGTTLPVLNASEVVAADVDFAVFATPPAAVMHETTRLVEAGARILDASGILASPPLPRGLGRPAPMVWPRLSAFKRCDFDLETVLTLPSGTASTVAPVLDALHAGAQTMGLAALKAVRATVLLPASHAGRVGIEALSRQAIGLLNYQPALSPAPFPALLAFNAIAPTPDDALMFEAQVIHELRALVPNNASLEFQPIWIPAFSGTVVILHLEFAGALDLATLTKVLSAHPDLDVGTRSAASTADDDDHEANTEDDEPAAVDADDPDALSLRDSLDRAEVRVAPPLFDRAQGHVATVRLVLMADPIHRTALAATTILSRWMAALDA